MSIRSFTLSYKPNAMISSYVTSELRIDSSSLNYLVLVCINITQQISLQECSECIKKERKKITQQAKCAYIKVVMIELYLFYNN